MAEASYERDRRIVSGASITIWLQRLAVAIGTGLVAFYLFGVVARVVARETGTVYTGPREPYLQLLTDAGVTIRWMTQQPRRGWVRYGPTPHELDHRVDEFIATVDHSVRLQGLKPGTRYYYAVGFDLEVFSGGTTDDWFQTAPPVDTARSTRIWAIGDSGAATDSAHAASNAMLQWVHRHPRAEAAPVDVWLMLGDNAYRWGKNPEYQTAVFERYRGLLRNTPVWPTLGNHDARQSAYFEIFELPRRGEAGGAPSGSENYYSFDYANIHFVCLDSQGSDRRAGGEMLAWLERDMAETRQDWLIAFWHHPPYSRGSHDSDDRADSRGRMHEMRENVLPILESGGVDLVLAGHSHSYERSYLLDRHYGDSRTLDPAMILDRGDGGPDGDGAYFKPTPGLGRHEGAVYVVVGSSSKAVPGPLDHPAMCKSLATVGSLVIDVQGGRLDGRFIDTAGAVRDHFTILKAERGEL